MRMAAELEHIQEEHGAMSAAAAGLSEELEGAFTEAKDLRENEHVAMAEFNDLRARHEEESQENVAESTLLSKEFEDAASEARAWEARVEQAVTSTETKTSD